MLEYKVLWIDVNQKTWEIKNYPIPPYLGPVDIGVRIHLEEIESFKEEVFSGTNVLFLGTGPFAGGKIFGTHRLVAVFRSPESLGLHVSEMGGVGYKFVRSGVNGFAIFGKSPEPVVIFVEGRTEGINLRFETIGKEKLKEIYENYSGYKGTYAITKYLLDNYSDFFVKNKARAVLVGEGAFSTKLGSLVSIDVNPEKKELIQGSEDFAGRAGPGSVLAQAHGVVGLVVGGEARPQVPEIFSNIKNFAKFFQEVTSRDYTSAVNSATLKYRFDPKIGAGGTFGSNYPYYKEWLPTFCFNSIYLKREFRKKLADLILSYYWKPFKELTFEQAKTWKTCGEPCPVACKKVWKGKKVDYEPFQGIGPLIGVFNLDLASKIVDLIDQKGLDAIEAGHVVMFLLEAIQKELLTCEEVGVSEPPCLDPFKLNPKAWEVNGKLAFEIIEGLVSKKNKILSLIAEKGLRQAITYLENLYEDRITSVGLSFRDLALYQPYGEDGYMTPNFYWTKGFLIPIFITGKYWTDYCLAFTSPEEFAKQVYQRAIKEIGLSNAAFCRFHRGWAENLIPSLYQQLGISEYEEKMKEVYRNIGIYNLKAKALPQPLESEKATDIFCTLAEELSLSKWYTKFTKNKKRAYLEWFERFYLSYLYLVGIS
ncbi:aldehyde ferredoxin oxidoreductase N-terminal domain-containing protein [Thermodesulfobacterium hveragerdense]|uniref:aldehyde ferredoxin oxidoreductase N-terminal domain-containing protein n=1 Tax=Thermodesulfobacterium hveragerdense TaxID=53424 RepID=UPI0003F9957B|nr:aldehyde ferredoxin oxidoreductase N-terminal domain-containing protein [Thermodesulfobacterium hveragerdense]